MHEIPIPHILLCLQADRLLAITDRLPTLVFLRSKPLLLPPEMITQILDDYGRLGEDNRFLALGLELDDGRFAQRVDFFEFGGCEKVGLAFEGFEGVGQV